MTSTISPLAGTLSIEQVNDRERFVSFVLTDAEPWHREHLGRLYALWSTWNATYFGGRLVPPYILLSEPSNPRRWGDCGVVSGFGGRSQIRLRPSLLTGTHPNMRGSVDAAAGRFLLVADILLHEMVHQWHQEITGVTEESYHGHGPVFRDECNRIGVLLGLAPVRDMKRRGPNATMPSCAQWPHNVRPVDYYQGAYVPCSGDTSPGPSARDYGTMFTAASAALPEGDAQDVLFDWLMALPDDVFCTIADHVFAVVDRDEAA